MSARLAANSQHLRPTPLSSLLGSAMKLVAADLVAHAADGADQWTLGASIDFSPQVIDIHIDDVGDGSRKSGPCPS